MYKCEVLIVHLKKSIDTTVVELQRCFSYTCISLSFKLVIVHVSVVLPIELFVEMFSARTCTSNF